MTRGPSTRRLSRQDRTASTRPADARPEATPLSAQPLYEQVRKRVLEMLLTGRWPPGSVLPSEAELSASFGVAIGTVRRALSSLTAEGLLARRRKTGTVVTGRAPHHSLRMCFQYFRLHGPGDTLVHSEPVVHSYERRPSTPAEQHALGIATTVMVHVIDRVRRVDGVAIMRDRYVLPVASAPHLAGKADIPDLLYLHLFDRYGIRISALREKIHADMANREDAVRLEHRRPFAVLVIDEIAFDQRGAPVLLASHRGVTEGTDFRYINEIS